MWVFILGRFMPIILTLVPMIAGAANFKFKNNEPVDRNSK